MFSSKQKNKYEWENKVIRIIMDFFKKISINYYSINHVAKKNMLL